MPVSIFTVNKENLKLGWRVGRIHVCVRVVPACDRCGADIVNVEVRADNLQGLLPAPGHHGRARRAEHARAAGSRSRGIQARPPNPNPNPGGPHPCLVEEADFIAMPRPGLVPTPDCDFSHCREVGEGLQSFQPQKFRRAKSKERPLSGDRSFNPCLLTGARDKIR